MLPKKYHAIIFISILVMLLLLGLHLLGLGFGSGGVLSTSEASAAARTAAARNNSSQTASSSSLLLGNGNAAAAGSYRHPIVYDKLTGATNNQISEVLGATSKPTNDYPLDHYQQQALQQQHLQQQPFLNNNHRISNPHQDDFFGNLHRHQGGSFPQLTGPPMSHHHLLGPSGMRQLAPMMQTTMPPALRPPIQPLHRGPQPLQIGIPPLPPMAPPPPQQPANANQRQSTDNNPPAGDSLPSASSLAGNNGSRQHQLSTNNTQQKYQQPQQQQQQQQPVYYTPPIFAYNNNYDPQPRVPLNDPTLNTPYGFPYQQQPMGVPEPALSIDEYNARNQARMRQIGNQPQANNEVSQAERYGQPAQARQPENLLADPLQQQRHRQQMLDRNQLLFGPYESNQPPNQTSSLYPDAALSYRPLPPGQVPMRAPYAEFANHQPNDQSAGSKLTAARLQQPAKLAPVSERPPPPPPAAQLKSQAPSQTSPGQQSQSVGLILGGTQSLPTCAAQLQNSTQQRTALMICNDDPEYPTKEVMRALENYAVDRSIEQLLPQQLVQLHLGQRLGTGEQHQAAPTTKPITLDSLQPTLGGNRAASADPTNTDLGFPSANFEPMCRSTVYMAQPRRAKNLADQWKIVVNLPGHKYRGIAVSQMLRVEECSRPNAECQAPGAATSPPAGTGKPPPPPATSSLLPRSRCLQHYENQRLVAWSHQQGLHVDIFRVPVACSCHIRR